MEFNPSICLHLTILNKHHIIKHSYHISNCMTQKVTNVIILPGKLTSVPRLMLLKHLLKETSTTVQLVFNPIITKLLSGQFWNMHPQYGCTTLVDISTIEKVQAWYHWMIALGEAMLLLCLTHLIDLPLNPIVAIYSKLVMALQNN